MRWSTACSLLLLLLACSERSPLGAIQQPAGVESGWVGTWAVAPHADGTSFQDQTLRQIVRTSIGGSSVRVRISNAFGTQPLSIDSAHVAKRANGSSIQAETDKALLFGGQASISIPAGKDVTSDAAAFMVEPLSDLAVSFHVQGTPGGTTAHGTGLQDNYVAGGNVASSETLANAQVKGSYYFLTNLDVQNDEAWGAVVTLGASITDGVASSGNSNRRWPNDLAKRLSDRGTPVGVLNQGISGNRLLVDGSGQSALKRFERDVLAQTGVRWVIFSDDPINDLGSTKPTPSGDALIDGLKQLVAAAHAAGIEFWCSTLTPFEGAGYWSAAGETGRAAVNAFIKSPDSGCDVVVDQDAATHDPAKPTWYLPANDAGDHLHPNERGLQAIADAVPLESFSAPTGASGSGNGGSSGSGNTGGAAGSAAGGALEGGGGAAGTASAAGGTGGANHGGASAGGTSNAGGTGGSLVGGAASGSKPLTVAGNAGEPATAPSEPTPTSSGCSCRVAGAAPKSSLPSFVWLLFGLSAFSRRRSSKRS